MTKFNYSRREAIKLGGLAGMGLILSSSLGGFKSREKMVSRAVPASGEQLPVVGLGTWQTFDAGNSATERATLKQVLVEMNKYGGAVIDSSPMYGRSETVVGELSGKLSFRNDFFYATKVWTSGREAGIAQMERSLQRMQRQKMDLIQIHNLVDWKTHVKTLKTWKEKGKIKYWGITHYLDSAHTTLEKIIKAERPDFVQFNYSIRSRHAENALFKTIEQYKTAVIINRPYEGGALFRLVKGKQLPSWCAAYDIKSWGNYFLKFILSNELVTCVIPGTSKPRHLIDNMKAGYGKMPDQKGREKMYTHLRTL